MIPNDQHDDTLQTLPLGICFSSLFGTLIIVASFQFYYHDKYDHEQHNDLDMRISMFDPHTLGSYKKLRPLLDTSFNAET